MTKTSKTKKGLRVSIFGSDCTNNGVTSGKKDAIIFGHNIPEVFESDENTPALEIVSGNGGRKFIAIPTEKPKGCFGGMFGGNFVYSSDSRFPSDQPIHVHDRFETPSEYDHFSA